MIMATDGTRAMIVGRVARKPGRDLVELEFGQDGDAVEGLLPVHGYVVAQRFDRLTCQSQGS